MAGATQVEQHFMPPVARPVRTAALLAGFRLLRLGGSDPGPPLLGCGDDSGHPCFADPAFALAGPGAAGAGGSATFLEAAHLLRCASAIAFLPAALILRRLCFGGCGAAAASVAGPDSMARSSAILASMRVFWNS